MRWADLPHPQVFVFASPRILGGVTFGVVERKSDGFATCVTCVHGMNS